MVSRLVPWNQSGHHPRPRPDASLVWHHFKVMQVLVGLTHVGVLLLCRCDLTLHDLIRPHLNRVVRVKSFALATNGVPS